jgi:hypothetical protein
MEETEPLTGRQKGSRPVSINYDQLESNENLMESSYRERLNQSRVEQADLQNQGLRELTANLYFDHKLKEKA